MRFHSPLFMSTALNGRQTMRLVPTMIMPSRDDWASSSRVVQ
ncbi:hypothetical protein HMPREF3231_01507 [Bifidobacterium longum]|nr:hypothetical protein HMPREF3231_01507 [Bifidobacterium longum]